MKRCACCKELKDLGQFCNNKHTADGKNCYCRGCCRQKRQNRDRSKDKVYQNRWRSKNPERLRQRERERYAANPEAAKARQERYRAKNKEVISKRKRAQTLKYYGLTPKQYEERLKSQGYKCAICGSEDPRHWSNQFQVDHDHRTGKVRGLLCSGCNGGLGLLGDTKSRIRAALNYLVRHENEAG